MHTLTGVLAAVLMLAVVVPLLLVLIVCGWCAFAVCAVWLYVRRVWQLSKEPDEHAVWWR